MQTCNQKSDDQLTASQLRVLLALIWHVHKTGAPASLRDLAAALGNQINGVRAHLAVLRRKGVVGESVRVGSNGCLAPRSIWPTVRMEIWR